MTEAQRKALTRLCERYGVPFREADYWPTFDLPSGYVAGWIGGPDGRPGDAANTRENGPTLYVGVSAEGQVSS